MMGFYVALAALFLVVVALVVLLVVQQRIHDRFVGGLELRHHEERSELLTRIQRPTWAPPPRPRRGGDQSEEEPPRRDKSHEVGTVRPLRDVSEGTGDDGAA